MASRVGTWVAVAATLAAASWGRSAGASGPPVCTTTKVIAVPTGLGESFPSVDKDGDGVVDAAEDELAACATPKYFFDSEEPALGPNEPQILYAVFPSSVGASGLTIAIRYAELYAQDGGYIWCPLASGPWTRAAIR